MPSLPATFSARTRQAASRENPSSARARQALRAQTLGSASLGKFGKSGSWARQARQARQASDVGSASPASSASPQVWLGELGKLGKSETRQPPKPQDPLRDSRFGPSNSKFPALRGKHNMKGSLKKLRFLMSISKIFGAARQTQYERIPEEITFLDVHIQNFRRCAARKVKHAPIRTLCFWTFPFQSPGAVWRKKKGLLKNQTFLEVPHPL